MQGRGAMLPIVRVVVDDIEKATGERLFQRLRTVAIRLDIAHLLAEVVLRLAVQHGDFMAGLHQLRDQGPAYEQGSTDYQDS